VPLHDAFGLPMLNTIWVMLAGVRYDLDDVELLKLQKILTDMFSSMDVTGTLFNHFPWLRFVMPDASGYTQYMEAHQKLWSFLQEELLRHQHTYADGNAKNFIDVYLTELKTRKEENSYYSGTPSTHN
jgi:methyl farnesoate epoxidase / farnesoate epoxidase